MRKLSQGEPRAKGRGIMRALDYGEEFIVTHHGRPIGEPRPYKRRQFVPRDVLLAALRGAPSIDYEELRADLDAVVD